MLHDAGHRGDRLGARRCPPSRTAGRPGRRPRPGVSATSRRSAGVRRSRRRPLLGERHAPMVRQRRGADPAGEGVEERGDEAVDRCAGRPRRRPAGPAPAAVCEVTGPMETRRRAACSSGAPTSVAEVRDGRRRRERDRVDVAGPDPRRPSAGVGRGRHRAVDGEHVDRVAARGEAVGRARRGPARRGRAAPGRRPPGRGTRRAATRRRTARGPGRRARPRSASAAAVPGPIAATRTPARARASSPRGARPLVEEGVDAVGRGEHEPRVRRRGAGSSNSIGSSDDRRAARSRPRRAARAGPAARSPARGRG